MKSSKVVNQKATKARKSKRGTPQVCRYDKLRSQLLDRLRAIKERETGLPYKANRSLLVQDALDELLKKEGLLEVDAQPYSQKVG